MSTKHAFSMPTSPRRGCSSTQSRALPRSSRRCRRRQRRSSTSYPGVVHRQPPLPPGTGLRLLVIMGDLLRPPELLHPALNRHLGWRIKPLAGVSRNHTSPSSQDEAVVLQPLLHRTKKGGSLQPILDLRVLNWALHRLQIKMLTHRCMIKCIQLQDWCAAIDLKDAYFHGSIVP